MYAFPLPKRLCSSQQEHVFTQLRPSYAVEVPLVDATQGHFELRHKIRWWLTPHQAFFRSPLFPHQNDERDSPKGLTTLYDRRPGRK